MSEGTEQTVPIRIPKILHGKLKSRAAERGEFLGEMVAGQLAKLVAGNAHQRRIQKRKRTRLQKNGAAQ